MLKRALWIELARLVLPARSDLGQATFRLSAVVSIEIFDHSEVCPQADSERWNLLKPLRIYTPEFREFSKFF